MGMKNLQAIIFDAQKKAEKALEETQKLQPVSACDGQPIKAEVQLLFISKLIITSK